MPTLSSLLPKQSSSRLIEGPDPAQELYQKTFESLSKEYWAMDEAIDTALYRQRCRLHSTMGLGDKKEAQEKLTRVPKLASFSTPRAS